MSHAIRAASPGGTIRALAGEVPELALVAAILRLAVEDAQAGRRGARDWLSSAACRDWLVYLTPPDADVVGVQAALIRRLADPTGA